MEICIHDIGNANASALGKRKHARYLREKSVCNRIKNCLCCAETRLPRVDMGSGENAVHTESIHRAREKTAKGSLFCILREEKEIVEAAFP